MTTPSATPPPGGHDLAGFGDRAWAYVVDYAIYLAVTLPLTVPFMFWWIVEMIDWFNSGPQRATDAMLSLYLPLVIYVLVGLTVGVVFTYLYFVEVQLRRGGQTIGKSRMKIRVVPAAPGTELTRMHLVKRWGVAWLGAMIVPYLWLVDGLWQLWDKPLQQCIHDKAAATVVVKAG